MVNVTFFKQRRYADAIYYKDKRLDGGSIYGIDADFLDTMGYQIIRGRGFTKHDYKNYKNVVLLDETAANSFFEKGDEIGKIVEIKEKPFTVVGIVKKVQEYEPVINNMEDYYTYFNESNSGTVLMPDSTWPIPYFYDEPQNAAVKATEPETMSAAGKKAAEILTAQIVDNGESFKYTAQDLMEKAKSLQQISENTNRQLLWIASISLLVGGIGVMNIMLVSVTERTGEIGLKKAIGANKRKILVQFLTEASVLTSIGGLLGVFAGIILAQIISKVSGAPMVISVPATLLAVVFSMIIGLIFGLLPSVKAANMNPIEALRRM